MPRPDELRGGSGHGERERDFAGGVSVACRASRRTRTADVLDLGDARLRDRPAVESELPRYVAVRLRAGNGESIDDKVVNGKIDLGERGIQRGRRGSAQRRPAAGTCAGAKLREGAWLAGIYGRQVVVCLVTASGEVVLDRDSVGASSQPLES